MQKFNITVVVTVILLGAQVSAQDYNYVIRGGHVNQEFRSCNTDTCGPSTYCCRFTNSQYDTGYVGVQGVVGVDVSYFCMNDFQTSAQNTGIYQDQENYPFERFFWDCGLNKRYNSNWDLPNSGLADDGLPVELNNNDFWVWTWLILFAFFVSPCFYVLGFIVYWPLTTIFALYNFIVAVYSTGIMVFEYPQRLQFNEWILYPIRRQFIQGLIIMLGYLWLLVPLLNIFALPLLGLWFVNDFLDYPGWDQVSATIGMPFNGYDSSPTQKSQNDKYDHGHPHDQYHNTNDHSHYNDQTVYYY